MMPSMHGHVGYRFASVRGEHYANGSIEEDDRNKLSLMRSKRVRGMGSSLQFWFSTRF